RVRVLDPDTVEVLDNLLALDGLAYSLAVAPDGSLAVGGEHGQLRRIVLSASRAPTRQQSYGKIELLRDPWGIPPVFAATDAGAMYGLGFATAEDRGFQMYYNLRMIQGRLAELLGPRRTQRSGESALRHDRKMRTFGYYRAARVVADKLDGDTLA